MIDLPQFQVKLTARQQQILDLIQSAIAPVSYTHLDVYKRQPWWWLNVAL